MILTISKKHVTYIFKKFEKSKNHVKLNFSKILLTKKFFWRLLKHNWWDPLYERVRIHSDVFFDLTFNENSPLYDYINRASLEFQLMHVYDQQLCFLFYRCESPSLFLINWKWIVSKSSNKIDHHRFPSKFNKNQNTIEKNEFYEWKIWRTIMKTMNENSFICIKINSWFQYDKISPAFLFIIDSVSINFFNSWPFSDQIRSDQTKILSALLSIIDFIQINISITDFSKSTETSSALRFIIDSYRPTSDLFSAGIILRKQHHVKIFGDFHIEEYFHRFFFSWNWILNLFHFILFYIQWLVISFWSFSLMKQSYWKKWLLMIELFEKFWKVVVFRRQVCHNQYWLHTDYKPESNKKKIFFDIQINNKIKKLFLINH